MKKVGDEEPVQADCAICGETAEETAYFAKSYWERTAALLSYRFGRSGLTVVHSLWTAPSGRELVPHLVENARDALVGERVFAVGVCVGLLCGRTVAL